MSYLPSVLSRLNVAIGALATRPTVNPVAVIPIPTQTINSDASDFYDTIVNFGVEGEIVDMDINGSGRQVQVIIPNELVYDPSARYIYNIGKAGVLSFGSRRWHITHTEGDTTTSNDNDDTVTFYLRHRKINGTSSYHGIKGNALLTLFVAYGDRFRLGINPSDTLLTPISVTFNNNYNLFIVSRQSTLDEFEDAYID